MPLPLCGAGYRFALASIRAGEPRDNPHLVRVIPQSMSEFPYRMRNLLG